MRVALDQSAAQDIMVPEAQNPDKAFVAMVINNNNNNNKNKR